MNTGAILCAIPAACFGAQRHETLSFELLRNYLPALWTIERRLRKGVGVDEERTRYARLCRQVEDVVLGLVQPAAGDLQFAGAFRAGAIPCIRVGGAYIDLLACLHATGTSTGVAHEARLGATVFRPGELARHLVAFQAIAKTNGLGSAPAIMDRVWFLQRRVIPGGCGLVEVPDVLSDETSVAEEIMDVRTLWERLLDWAGWVRPASQEVTTALAPPVSTHWVPAADLDWKNYGEKQRGAFMAGRLRVQIEAALLGGPETSSKAGGRTINLANQRHKMLIEELQRLVQKSRSGPPQRAAMSYDNGQPARPFLLRCLDPLPDGWRPTSELHIGLVSMRHLPLDQYVDINWYRNIDVPSHKGLAGADEACFKMSVDQLEELLAVYKGHRLRAYVYHSGFLPAVVGFYRALTEVLSSGKHPTGCLQVIPMLEPKDDGHLQGRPWPV